MKVRLSPRWGTVLVVLATAVATFGYVATASAARGRHPRREGQGLLRLGGRVPGGQADRLRAELPAGTTGRAYFGDRIAGTVTAADFGVVSNASGAVATTLEQPLVKHVQRLNRIRRAIPALQKGQYSTEGISGSMAFKRRFTAGGVDSFALVVAGGSATFTGVPNGGGPVPEVVVTVAG